MPVKIRLGSVVGHLQVLTVDAELEGERAGTGPTVTEEAFSKME